MSAKISVDCEFMQHATPENAKYVSGCQSFSVKFAKYVTSNCSIFVKSAEIIKK